MIGMGIKHKMRDAMLDVVFGELWLVKAKNKQDLKKINKRCYYFVFWNRKKVVTTGQVLKQ